MNAIALLKSRWTWLAIGAALLLGALSVQTIRVERLRLTVEQKNRALDKAAFALNQCSASLESASSAIGRQNAAVEALRAEGVESAKRQAKALSEAQAANSRADEALGRIRARKVVGCETGREIMESPL